MKLLIGFLIDSIEHQLFLT